jgi:hypothetical protein
VVLARGRFLLLVGGFLAILAAWPFLRNTFDKLTATVPPGGSVSGDTEYWCPMCPGVVSDWPAKCPVCSMALVRRQKGEMTPLPDGVVARVQLSPYRIQLAGLRTAPVEFRKLEREVVVAGKLEPPSGPGSHPPFALIAEVFEPGAAALRVGQVGSVVCDARPGEPAVGRVAEISGRRVRVLVDDPHGDLRPGGYAAATFRTPVAHTEPQRRAELARWGDRVAVGSIVGPNAAFAALADTAVRQVLAREGLTLAVPEAAVIDTGTRRVVFVESMPGTFDAVEVQLGRRCGDHYIVRGGLEAGQRVVAAGAVLLDAETRLNPSLAASYFGAGSRPSSATPQLATPPPAGTLSPEDRLLADRQKLCPVTGEPLDSMGGPVRVSVAGRTVFICCKGCEKPLLRKPKQYLAKLPP